MPISFDLNFVPVPVVLESDSKIDASKHAPKLAIGLNAL
jgi:hypothetical protein